MLFGVEMDLCDSKLDLLHTGSQQQGGSAMQPIAAGRLKNWEDMQDIDLEDQEPLK